MITQALRGSRRRMAPRPQGGDAFCVDYLPSLRPLSRNIATKHPLIDCGYFFEKIFKYFDIKINIINFVSLINQRLEMKYSELHKILRKAGMIEAGEQRAGHPLWLNPRTGERFTTSNHGSREVANGTLKSILRSAGIQK